MHGQRQTSLVAQSKTERNPFRRAISMASAGEVGRLITSFQNLFEYVLFKYVVSFKLFQVGISRNFTN